MGIKINNQSIAKLYLGNIAVKRAYSNGAIVYDTGGQQPCFEVVTNISSATGNYVDVYVTSEEKWYKKNNLDQFEAYGIMPQVADLSTLTYYVGKLAINTSDNHEYKWNGTQWEDLGSAIGTKNVLFIDPASSSSKNVAYDFKYYFGDGYKIRVLFYLTSGYSYSSDFRVLGYKQSTITGYGTAPIEWSLYSNGFYLDSHYPISGYNGTDYYPGDYSSRLMKQSEMNNRKGRKLLADIGFNKVTLLNLDGSNVASYGSDYHATTWGTAISKTKLVIIGQLQLHYGSAKHPAHIGYVQVYDNNGNLVNDIRPALDENSHIYLHDNITNADYTAPSTKYFEYHYEQMTDIVPPEEYDTKVAPANNVHYNTLSELEMMECPWNGMMATIGANYDLYIYMNNRWTHVHNLPCYEVVDTITDATGNFVDVYATDTSKWYKKNNLSQYEEYGIMPEVADLSTLTYYVGKLAICTTDNHEYKWNGTTWVDLGELSEGYTEYEYLQGNGTSYILTDYIPKSNSRAEVDVEGRNASSGTTGAGEGNIFGSIQQIDGVWQRFTFTYPYYNVDGNTGGLRIEVGNQQLGTHDDATASRGIIKIDKDGGYINNTKFVTFNGSFTGNNVPLMIFTKNIYTNNVNTPAGLPYTKKIYNVKFYEGDTLVRNYVPAILNGTVGFYDTVNKSILGSAVSTPFTAGGSSQEHTAYPEDYDTKVAPPNNVHYNTLVELELQVCPWNGMQATVGDNYDLYLYWNNHWNKCGTPCFEVVSTLSKASGNYIDVYVTDVSKWYKKNNLSQYEEYGLLPIVDSLNSVTYYTGKMVILSTDNHEYKWDGSQWIDLGATTDLYTKYEYLQCNGTSYIITDYIPNDNTAAEIDIQGLTGGYQVFGALNYWSSTGSAAKRLRIQAGNAYGDSIRYDRGANSVYVSQSGLSNRIYLRNDSTGGYLNGTKIATFSSSTEITGCQAPLGICTAVCYDFDTSNIIIQPGIVNYNGKIYSMKIYEGDTLVRNFVPAIKDNVTGLYDTVNKVLWNSEVSTQFTVGGSSEPQGNIPEDYDTKVAPSDNVHYNTLQELMLAECPWVGMQATVGDDYTLYVYSINGWVIGEMPLDLPYLRFTPITDANFSFSGNGLKYSINGSTWLDLIADTPITVASGSYVMFKGSNLTPSPSNGIGTFSSTGNFNISGNIMSLHFDDDFPNQTSLSGKKFAFRSLFRNNTCVKDCTNLVMPATTLSNECYRHMFSGCTGLSAVSSTLLPANTLSSHCYASMFEKCSSLTTPPQLPAMNLASYCYYTMFSQCRRLTSLPTLPATVMVDHCYDTMFNYVGLSVPENYLPSTQLAPYCYYAMFANADKSSVMSVLPATTLASHCYDTMFINNGNLRNAPALPATTLVDHCYDSMFQNCSNLNNITALFTTTPSPSYCSGWVSGVSSTGTFHKNPNATWDQSITRGTSTVPTNWTIDDYSANYIKFTVVDDNGSTFQFSKAGLKYSIDDGAWTDLAANTDTPLVAKDHNIRFKGEIMPNGSSGIGTFTSSGTYKAGGNLMNLLYGDYYVGNNGKLRQQTFESMFQNSNVVDASTLLFPPSCNDYMCRYMFKGSTSLVTPPASLPFTSGNYHSCRDMFMRCTAMTSVPSMNVTATTTAISAFQSMFQECSSIVNADNIVISSRIYYDAMTTMFMGCSSLKKTPILKGSFSNNCARQAFAGCSQLTDITYLGTVTPNSSNTTNWLPSGCTATFYMNQNATWDSNVSRDANGIPSGCTIVKIDPSSV